MKVENMTSNKNNKIANQFILYDDDKTQFQSYETLICTWQNHELTLNGSWWDYSNTTRKYFYMFLREHTNLNITNKKDMLEAIKNNTVKVV
jgi:hypothetical protein